MQTPIRVLIVEDSEDDALLLVRELKRGGFSPYFMRVQTPEAMRLQLHESTWDVIISDYVMPRFSGPDALLTLRKTGLDIPFIVVSGKLGEETAVEAMKAGAHDYVMKSNLSRLVPAIKREIRESEMRRDKKTIEDALRYSDKKYNTILETTQEGIWMLYDDGRISYVNQRIADMLGCTIQEILGRPVTDFAEERRRVDIPYKNDRRKTVLKDTNDFPLRRKDGTKIWVQSSSRPLFNENEQYIGTMEMMTDITERKLAETALTESERKFRLLSETSSAGIFIYRGGKFLYINPACEKITGYRLDELMQMDLGDIVHPDFKDIIGVYFPSEPIPASQPSRRLEIKIVKKDSRESWLDFNAIPLEYDGKQAVMGMFVDITDQRIAQERLLESEALYRTFAEESLAGVYVIQGGKVLYVNNNAASLTGYEPEELIGNIPVQDLVHPEDRDKVKQYAREMLKGQRQTPYEFRLVDKKGNVRWMIETVASIQFGGHPAVLGNFMDLTEPKQKEEALRQSEERYRTILENIEDGYYEVDIKGSFTFFNDATLHILGYARKELLGLNNRDWMDKENARKVFQIFNQVFRTGQPSKGHDWEFTKKDGNRGFAEASITLIRDARGNPAGFRGIIRDVTERIRAQKTMENMIVKLEQSQSLLHEKNIEVEKAYAEIKAAQTRIVQHEKMASIGQLAAGIAHEINNPIGFISGNLGVLRAYINKMSEIIKRQDEIIEKPESKELVEALQNDRKKWKIDYILKDVSQLITESIDGSLRVKKIVQDLKTFSKLDEAKYKIENINEGLESTINLVWNQISQKATLNKEFGELPQTLCNLGQINQVFMNLLLNAAQSIDKFGEITIRTRADEGNIYISIKDTGHGIPEERLTSIFEPFYTTQEIGKGTGLGLSVTYDIVKKHGGEITVESKISEGTTFTVRIPILTT